MWPDGFDPVAAGVSFEDWAVLAGDVPAGSVYIEPECWWGDFVG